MSQDIRWNRAWGWRRPMRITHRHNPLPKGTGASSDTYATQSTRSFAYGIDGIITGIARPFVTPVAHAKLMADWGKERGSTHGEAVKWTAAVGMGTVGVFYGLVKGGIGAGIAFTQAGACMAMGVGTGAAAGLQHLGHKAPSKYAPVPNAAK